MDIVGTLTKDCPREDCSIAYESASTTLSGFTQTYDKQGRPQHRDPNTRKAHYRCESCGKGWEVKSRDGERDKISMDDLRNSAERR